jgi:AraC family transcriptional regulator, transcriptional activator of pobA
MNTSETVIEAAISVKKFDRNVTDYSDDQCYTILWMKKGFASIEVDFDRFSLQPNSVYFVTPGKNIILDYNGSPEGWLLRFSKGFLHGQIREPLILKDVDIFAAENQIPRIVLSPKIGDRVDTIAEMIDELETAGHPHKHTASASLLKTLLLYCDSHCNIKITHDFSRNQLYIVTTFKHLVSRHYHRLHSVTDYAGLMNISPKYLNQVVKEVLGVTAKSVIHEQLIIRARRELKFTDDSIKEIAYALGFSDPFYFSNYFKKEVGCSPSEYRMM